MIKLVIDLGAKLIKYILINNDSIINSGIIHHDCIYKYNIIKFNTLNNIIKQLKYELEVDFLTTIDYVVVSFDFCEILIKDHNKNIKINQIVKQEDINELQKQNEEKSSFNINYLIDIVNDNYIIDGHFITKDPLALRCNNVTYRAQFIYVNPLVINQISSLFSKFTKIEMYVGSINVMKYLQKYHKDFILIDIGYTNSRVIRNSNNHMELNCYFNGIDYFYKTIKEKTLYKEEFPQINIFEHHNLIKNFFHCILPDNYNDDIFIIGSAVYIPILHEFLKQTLNWRVQNLQINDRVSKKYNSDIFLKCFIIGLQNKL